MQIGERKKLNKNWQAIAEVNTGDGFLIQNVSEVMVNFVVTDSEPLSDNIGGILLPYQQMQFKKVGGDLYMKSTSANGEINIEQSE